MSAGNLSVSVEADLQKLEAQFAAIEKGFVESGKRAMQAFQKATAETPLPADDMVGRLAGEIKAAGKEAGQAFAREVGIAIKELMPQAVEKSLKGAMPRAVGNAMREGAGDAMRRSGDDGGLKFSENFQKKAAGMMRNLAGPMIAAQLANTVSDVIRSDKSMPDAILDAVKGIPFAGAFANLGEAIYDATFGAADKAAQDLRDKAASFRADILEASARQEGMRQEEQSAQASLMIENRRLELERNVLKVKQSGSESGIVRAEYEKKQAALRLDFELARAKTTDEATLNLLQEQHDTKLEMARIERDTALKDIDERAKKEMLAAEEKSRDDAQRADDKRRDDEDKARQKAIAEANAEQDRINKVFKFEEDKRKQLADLEDERMASQAAGIGSVQTALGSFKFDAYPAAEKKKNDEKMVLLMTAIRDQQMEGGFI